MMNEEGFFDKVYKIVKQIPYGKVSTYGIIANYLGTPRSARMVGWALNASRIDNTVPAHRVVNKNGILTGKHHFNGINLMKQLLENENIMVTNNQIIDFENKIWDPLKELGSQ